MPQSQDNAGISSSAPNDLLAVKKIPRDELMRQITLTPQEMATPNTEAEIERLKKKKMHHLVRECMALQTLNHIDHVLQYVDREWTPQHGE